MKNALNTVLFLVLSQIAISQNTILWKVTDTTTNKTSHIVGTFHQFGSSFVNAIPEIKSALLNADMAIFESIVKVEETRNKIAQRKSSDAIEKHLSKKTLRQLKTVTKDWEVDLYKLKPIEISWKLRQEHKRIVCKTSLPTDEFDAFDYYLMHLAEKNNIPLKGLETNQLEVINKVGGYPDWKKERKMIKIWVNKILKDEMDHPDCDFADQYRNMNLDYEFEKECEEDYVIFERNNLWMKELPDLLRNNNAFVAVGYAHLQWQCGLLEQLKNLGFKVEQVAIKPVPYKGEK